MSERPESGQPARFIRRLTTAKLCAIPPGCPDVWELSDGNVAIIGVDATDSYAGLLPEGVGIGHGERLVVVPRELMNGLTI
jgi:hypothetical protein